MRRSERQIVNRIEIDAVIRSCQVCRVGFTDGNEPYIVPMCFGYDGEWFYFHCAQKGRKLDLLRRNPRVCVELDEVVSMVPAENACGWTMRFRSVMGAGVAEIVEGMEAKQAGLTVIMNQYTDRNPPFTLAAVEKVCVFRVRPEWLTGKQSLP